MSESEILISVVQKYNLSPIIHVRPIPTLNFFFVDLRKDADLFFECEWVLSSIIGRFFSYVAGAIVGVLLFLTLLDSNVLIYFHLWGRALVWYLAVTPFIFLFSNSKTVEK